MVEIRRTPSTRRRKMADHFTEQVAKKEALRRKALRHKDETVWFGLGMMGIVGWAVAIPTLVGIAIGLRGGGALEFAAHEAIIPGLPWVVADDRHRSNDAVSQIDAGVAAAHVRVVVVGADVAVEDLVEGVGSVVPRRPGTEGGPGQLDQRAARTAVRAGLAAAGFGSVSRIEHDDGVTAVGRLIGPRIR